MCRLKSMVISGLLVVILATVAAYGDYESIQSLTSYEREGRIVNFKCKSDTGEDVLVKLEICTRQIIRVRMSPAGDFKQAALIKYGVVKTNWPDVDFTIEDAGDMVRIETGQVIVKVNKSPFRLSFLNRKGKVITEESDAGMGYDKKTGHVIERTRLLPDEHFFGSNARFRHPLDMRGAEVLVRVGRKGHKCQNRINIPFFMSTNGYGIFFNTTWPQIYKFGTESPDYGSFEVKGGDLDYYFIYGPTLADILDRYTDITGKTPLPPKWAFGTWVNTYGDQKTALAIARKFRQEGLPADAFRIDSCWMAQDAEAKADGSNYKGYDALQWDKHRYPKPKEMIDQMHKMGFKFSLWNEYRVNTESAELFKYASDKGYLIKNRDGTVNVGIRHHSGEGTAAEVDFSNPDATRWWWNRPESKALFEMGMDVYKLDNTDDADFVDRDDGALFYNGMSEEEMHNLYLHLFLKSAFEQTKELLKQKNRRGLIFAACGWAGTQRYPIHWPDDIEDKDIKHAIRYVQNLGLSGISFAYGLHHNLWGFRNCQFGMLSPIAEDFYGDRILTISREELDIYRRYHKLHYRLLPYIYTYAHISNITGLPITRAMVLEYPDDPNIYDKDLQYMFGTELLVAPVYQSGKEETPVATIDVYLPRGKWIDYWTGDSYTGPRSISYTAKIDRIPLFVKAGAIIPMQPDMDYVGQKPVDPLTLDIYPFETSSFTLYQDDGETEEYRSGAFALTTFSCMEREDGIKVHIGESKGQYKGKLPGRAYILKVNQVSAPGLVKIESKTVKRCTSHKELGNNTSGWWYDCSKQLVLVKTGVIAAANGAKIYLTSAKSI